MGLKRRSRFAYAACLLGANAPDIDIFAPRFFPVEGMHVSPRTGPWGVRLADPCRADRRPLVARRPVEGSRRRGHAAVSAWPLFAVTFLAVLTHPFLDWLTTYAIAIFAPHQLALVLGRRDLHHRLGLLAADDRRHCLVGSRAGGDSWPIRAARLRSPARSCSPTSPSTSARVRASKRQRQRSFVRAAFRRPWWLLARRRSPFGTATSSGAAQASFGSGDFDLARGLTIDPGAEPLRLDDLALAEAERTQPHVRAYMVWSRMPVVIRKDGHSYLIDQRFYGPLRSRLIPGAIRHWFRDDPFLVPLDKRGPSS